MSGARPIRGRETRGVDVYERPAVWMFTGPRGGRRFVISRAERLVIFVREALLFSCVTRGSSAAQIFVIPVKRPKLSLARILGTSQSMTVFRPRRVNDQINWRKSRDRGGRPVFPGAMTGARYVTGPARGSTRVDLAVSPSV